MVLDSTTDDRVAALIAVCEGLSQNSPSTARSVARERYPFAPVKAQGRNYTARESMRVFRRDGFIDQYSGARLVFPGALRLLSTLLPQEFPFHKNWKMSETHPMFWELFPTIDHVVPVARGGSDAEENWACTSMLRNSAKSNWLLSELGWSRISPHSVTGWDGLTDWFLDQWHGNTALESSQYLKRWYDAAVSVQAG